MSKVEESIGFYSKISELQERLRRSEEERLQLEEKFAVLMRSCRDEEEEKLNSLREKYEAFLAEERQRRERNDRILQALNRVESRTAMLTAKSERLRLLRRHYEACMLKIYPGWKYVTHKFTDSQLSSQNLDPPYNKVEADRTSHHGGLWTSPSLLPTDYSRTAALSLHHNYSTVGTVPASHQCVSASRAAVATSAARTMQGLPLPSPAHATVSFADIQQQVPSSVISTGEHSVQAAQKAPPLYTQETLESSQNNETGQTESNRLRHLDDYLGRAAEMLKLSRAGDGERDKNMSGDLNEINANNLKDPHVIGNSVDFELEQNTSGDLLNVSLSDDGVLQEEINRTLTSANHENEHKWNLGQAEKVTVTTPSERVEVVNKQVQFHEDSDPKDVVLGEQFEDLNWEGEQPHREKEDQQPVKCRVDDVENFETALDRKDGQEYDNQQHLYRDCTAVAGGDSVIPENKIYCSEEENEIFYSKQQVQQYSVLNGEEQHQDKQLEAQKRIQSELSVHDPLESKTDAKRGSIDESSAEELGINKRAVPVNESIRGVEEDQPDKLYEGEGQGSRQLTEQKQWDENEQQYYQQYVGYQEGDQYYQYGEDEIYQQEYDQEHVEGYDQQYLGQEGQQYYEQYGEQVEGEYSQEGQQYYQQYGEQVEGQDCQEGLQNYRQYGEQVEGQDSQKGLQNYQQDRQHEQQYIQQQAGQYDQYYEEQQLQSDIQHISEGKQTAQDDENKRENEQVCDDILDQRQQPVCQRDWQEDASDGSSYGVGRHNKQMKAHEATQGSVGEGSQESGSAGIEQEKTLSRVVGGKIDGSTALSEQLDVSSDLTEASPSRDTRQYQQLLAEGADPEQSDTDEMEVQLAELVGSQQVSEKSGKQLQQSVLSRTEKTGKVPIKVAPLAVENIDGSTTSTDSHKNLDKLASRTGIMSSEATGQEGNMHGNPKAQILSTPEIQSVALPKEGDLPKVPQPLITRAESKKLPGLIKMLESDTESLQLDTNVSNEDSDDFDFSSDK